MVSYVSAEASASGILVEYVLHLTLEDDHHDLVEANVIFGCGQVQSEWFLDDAALNVLFRLVDPQRQDDEVRKENECRGEVSEGDDIALVIYEY
ncbi:hypothetical protein RYX36_006237 [Vicia faba]